MKEQTYEERVYEMIKQFTTQDLQRLIDFHIDAAGLLLIPAFAGMIGLGHFLYGFDLGDRAVFLKFAQYRMKIKKALAEILFDNVRAGLLAEWCAASRIVLFAWDGTGANRICWQRPGYDTHVAINASQIGRLYISAVQKLPSYSDTPQYKENLDAEYRISLREQVTEYRATLQGE